MPSRIVREGILSSPRVNALSMGAELLYRRLMSVVDDYGRFYASPATVRGACFPINPETVCEQDVSEWLAECSQAQNGQKPLIRLYAKNGCKYLQIEDFGQQVRSKSKFPAPCDQNDINLESDCSQNDRTSRIRIRSRIRNSESESKPPETVSKSDEWAEEAFEQFWKAYPNKIHKDQAARSWVSLIGNGEISETNWRLVIAGVERYKVSRAWHDPKFIPSPHVFLTGDLRSSGRRWKDEPEPWKEDWEE